MVSFRFTVYFILAFCFVFIILMYLVIITMRRLSNAHEDFSNRRRSREKYDTLINGLQKRSTIYEKGKLRDGEKEECSICLGYLEDPCT